MAEIIFNTSALNSTWKVNESTEDLYKEINMAEKSGRNFIPVTRETGATEETALVNLRCLWYITD